MRVGVIGLGTMGAPIARNLLKRGHIVTVFARRAEAMAPLLAAGAVQAGSPAEVASLSDVAITIVTDAAAVEDVTLGPGGLIEGAQPGLIAIDHSTIEPAVARRIAAALLNRGVSMLDAPVSGGGAAAEVGSLSVMIGGEEAALERARPVIECYSAAITYVGPNGAGQVAKACNQICTVVNMLGAAEAILLAERAGVDTNRIKNVLMAGLGSSRILELQAPKMTARDFTGKVESRLHYKDINIVLDIARTLGIELPATFVAAQVLTSLQQRGGARRDTAAIFEVIANPEPKVTSLP
jgi:2-hydroxy-3-oxopropionate reductase